MKRTKLMPEVNTGSMADIAFLLLIFFLVTATISKDAGINRKLPKECPPGTVCETPIKERDILRILINDNDDIMVEDKLVNISELKEITKIFVDNNGDGSCEYCNGERYPENSSNPRKAVISLQSSRQSTYQKFIAVQDELTKAYLELRNTFCKDVLKKSPDKLSKLELEKVKAAYPFILSEAEINNPHN
ncbi:ExbD/TolR family protein [Snuella sedimenti]|uniref:Biopolymer transporter ExbD n=1 Tax=Snuella sedimenti TaxID=2798802 RepID=A0A8J7JDP6_9FLAO|nr:biopolymer transporter ExbD [Snuella sedimenti]MBJ6369229.1 biopolymer transporter ExbD [Snuella sedimenti]